MYFFGAYIEGLSKPKDTRLNLKSPGFIYLIKRSDGVYKIGKTINVPERISSHASDYRMSFEIIKVWCVPDYGTAERIALTLTKSHSLREGNRNELRQMTDIDTVAFIETFSRYCNEWIS